MGKIQVFIADDHCMVRQGIKQLLEFQGDITVIGEANDGEEALEKIKVLEPEIALIDINMPKINGLEVTKRIKQLELDTKIILLTIHNEIEYLMKAINEGVDGYILKDSDLDVLVEAIKTVYDGGSCMPKEMMEEMSFYGKNSLSEREVDVLRFLTMGLLNKQIAKQLNISEKTVKNHISRIFKKIGVSDRTQAAVFAIKNSIIDIHAFNT